MAGRRRAKRTFRRGIRRTAKYYRKFKRYVRKKRGHLKITRAKIRPVVMADEVYCKLKYTERLLYTPGVNFTNWIWITYRANSLFDPNFAVGGGQPTGFDQWTNFFSKYRVTACKMTVHFHNSQTDTTYWALHATLASSPDTVFANYQPENLPNTRFTRTVPYIATSEIRGKKLSMYMTTKKMYPNRDTKLEEGFSSDYSTNPNLPWYFVFAGCTAAGVGVATRLIIQMKFYTVFSQRFEIAES